MLGRRVANLFCTPGRCPAILMTGEAHRPRDRACLCRQGIPRPRCPKPAPRLHLRPKTRGLRPHQTRAHAALRHRGGDRTYESRGPSRPLLSQRSRRRCRQRHPQCRRLQPSPRSRLAEDHFARHPTRATPDLHNSASPQTGFLTGDGGDRRRLRESPPESCPRRGLANPAAHGWLANLRFCSAAASSAMFAFWRQLSSTLRYNHASIAKVSLLLTSTTSAVVATRADTCRTSNSIMSSLSVIFSVPVTSTSFFMASSTPCRRSRLGRALINALPSTSLTNCRWQTLLLRLSALAMFSAR